MHLFMNVCVCCAYFYDFDCVHACTYDSVCGCVCLHVCVCVCVCAHTEGGSLAERMKVTLDDHSQQGASLWDGFMGSSRHTPR